MRRSAAARSVWDFPLHATEDRFFDLHWRIERHDRVVEAIGLVEATRVDGVADVTVELRGLDTRGQVVSRGLGRTSGGRLLGWQRRPFAVRLRPTGQEARFQLSVWSFTWEGEAGAALTGTSGSPDP